MKTDLRQFSNPPGTTGPYANHLDLDVLIVGAGFSGIYCLHELRQLGLKTVLFEAAHDLGGTWRWNRYPGARVDSQVPQYQYSWPETWANWTWSTNYPSYDELRAYFDHVESVLDIKKDCALGTVVVGAEFNPESGRWKISTEDGREVSAKYFIVATGFAAKRYIPEWPGVDSFRGQVHHSAFWPEEGVELRGKKCAVIGTGASGVQITQALGPVASSLKVFQRTPNLALPMRPQQLTAEEQDRVKPTYPELFQLRETSFAGFTYDFLERGVFEDDDAERTACLERMWELGGFRYWVGTYKDYLFDPKANRVIYDFWCRKVRARIENPVKRDLLAPLEPLHPWGVKRPSLEVSFYEEFNRPTVDLVDVRTNPIESFTEKGVRMADGTEHELDVVCIATGFDTSTGALTNMGLRSIHGTWLKEEWAAAVHTHLGLTIHGYPNLFLMYGPQAPTVLSNGPTCVEVQGRWIVDTIKTMERRGIKSIEPTLEATQAWKQTIDGLSNRTLLSTTRSTYMGGTFPGKPFEQLNYSGGVYNYRLEIRKALPSFEGFTVVME
ncbi:FAD/NAD(P)-binding domain-containing protein [Aspergillus heteromorphus CBS 117.55]|uniref:FAD/NAD(P)-binding domain-containing protein n=1 Tax=Aspergillus heteromorphus CBS 117.55 TaxID=1448321 RepID=A0A317V641_9EURO|nr:FAD/NAD(P)-binding domain-containing protein [Aspergillus heteromorphus CBS 117.55]PWY68397.1 FAD/NAD(P)-binding domain-containing protein [Aspergillus heteromorphus CBS 117.55]